MTTKTIKELNDEVARLYSEGSDAELAAAIAAHHEACFGGYENFRNLMAEVDSKWNGSDIEAAVYEVMADAINNGCATMVELGRGDDVFGSNASYSKATVGHILRSLECLLSTSAHQEVIEFYASNGVRG